MIELLAAYVLGVVTGALGLAGFIYYKYREKIRAMKKLAGIFDA